MHVLSARVLLQPIDLDASVDFYERQLGLVRYRDWGWEGAGPRGVVYFLGGGYLELTEGAGSNPREDGRQGIRLWLQVADVQAARDELAGAGVAIVQEPTRQPWGLIESIVHDPDGLPLILVEIPVDHPLRRRR